MEIAQLVKDFLIDLVSRIIEINSMPIYLLSFMCILGYAAYTDCKEMKIYNNFNLFALLIRMMFIPLYPISVMDVLCGIVFFVLFLVVGMINPNNNMAGDIKFAGIFGLWAGVNLGMSSLIIAILILLPYSIYKKTPQPLAPFIVIGTCLTFICINIVGKFIV